MNKKFNSASFKKFWRTAPKGRYLCAKEILGLGAAGLGVSFISSLINMYVTISHLPMLYHMGPDGPIHATIISIVSCILGLVFTPIYGKAMQRTKTKHGRYKPYLLLLSPIVALLGVLAVWVPDRLNEVQTTIYVYLICIPTLFVFNLWYNTWNFIPGVFTPNQQERADIWAPIGILMGIAPTILHMLKDVFAGLIGDVIAARIFGICSAVLGMACVLCLLSVKERVFITEEESEEDRVGVWAGLKMVFKNKPLIVLMLFAVLGCMRSTIDMSWFVVSRIKYADTMAKGSIMCGYIGLIVGFAATPNLLLLPLLTRKFNKRTIMIVWSAINTLSYMILGFIGIDNLESGKASTVAIITIIKFFASFNAMASLQSLMVSELGDYQQYLTGYRLDGFIQTLVYSVPLVATQLFALIPAFIQRSMGFDPFAFHIHAGHDHVHVDMPDANAISIAERYCNIAIWISVISGLLALIAICFYTLDKKKHQEIMVKLKANSTNAKEIDLSAGALKGDEDIEPIESVESSEKLGSEPISETLTSDNGDIDSSEERPPSDREIVDGAGEEITTSDNEDAK